MVAEKNYSEETTEEVKLTSEEPKKKVKKPDTTPANVKGMTEKLTEAKDRIGVAKVSTKEVEALDVPKAPENLPKETRDTAERVKSGLSKENEARAQRLQKETEDAEAMEVVAKNVDKKASALEMTVNGLNRIYGISNTQWRQEYGIDQAMLQAKQDQALKGAKDAGQAGLEALQPPADPQLEKDRAKMNATIATIATNLIGGIAGGEVGAGQAQVATGDAWDIARKQQTEIRKTNTAIQSAYYTAHAKYADNIADITKNTQEEIGKINQAGMKSWLELRKKQMTDSLDTAKLSLDAEEKANKVALENGKITLSEYDAKSKEFVNKRNKIKLVKDIEKHNSTEGLKANVAFFKAMDDTAKAEFKLNEKGIVTNAKQSLLFMRNPTTGATAMTGIANMSAKDFQTLSASNRINDFRTAFNNTIKSISDPEERIRAMNDYNYLVSQGVAPIGARTSFDIKAIAEEVRYQKENGVDDYLDMDNVVKTARDEQNYMIVNSMSNIARDSKKLSAEQMQELRNSGYGKGKNGSSTAEESLAFRKEQAAKKREEKRKSEIVKTRKKKADELRDLNVKFSESGITSRERDSFVTTANSLANEATESYGSARDFVNSIKSFPDLIDDMDEEVLAKVRAKAGVK